MIPNVLITNDPARYKMVDIAKTDMVISISNDGKFFNIYKNRYGCISTGAPGFPISLLPHIVRWITEQASDA
jgi:hypothetical protein